MLRVVTIALFYWPTLAYLARCRLAACGIEAWVLDEHTTSLFWHYSNLLGGIRLQVSSDDVEDACAVLDDDPRSAEEPILTKDEQATERALRAAIFGVLNPVFYLWGLGLLIRVFFRRLPTSAIERRNVLLAIILIAVPAVASLLFTLAWRL
jgi:hypothetical protein